MIRSDLAMAALACAAVPGMKPVSVATITPVREDPDLDDQLALVEDTTGRRWFVRAPRTVVGGARLEQVDLLVQQLPRHVPFKVPAAVGYADLGKPTQGRAAVYPYLEGSSLDLGSLPAGPGLASALGRVLAAIHNIPRQVFEEQDVPLFDAAGCRQRLIAEVDRAAETGRVPTGLLARWEEAFEAPALWQFATTPVHGSFRGNSVLVTFTEDDASTGRVVAVTGWADAMVADPAVDLAELYARATPEAWEAVLDSYAMARAQRPDPYLHARARLVAELRRLHGLAHNVAEGHEDVAQRTVEALRRLDRLTEAEDSLVPISARGVGATVRQRGDSPVGYDDGDDPVPYGAADVEFDETPDDAEDLSMAGAVTPEPEAVEHGEVAEVSQGGGSEDPTMEVPSPFAAPFDDETPEDGSIDEMPDDVALDEASEDGIADEASEDGSSDADPDDLAADSTLGQAPPEETPEEERPDELDLGDDAERLHEVYGMPAPEDDSGR